MSQHIDPMPKQTTLDTIAEDIETYRPITSYTTLADIKSMLSILIGTMAGSQTKNVLFATGTDTSLAPFKSWGNYSGYVTKVNDAGTYWVGHFIAIDGNDVEIGCNNGTITAYSLNGKLTDPTKLYLTDVITGISVVNNDTYQIGKLIISNIRFTTTANISANENLFKLPKPKNSGGLSTSSAIVKTILEETVNRTSYNATILGSGYVYGSNAIPSGKTLILHACYIAE